jgi:predicted transcriptional regulator
MREDREVERARRALARCVAQDHDTGMTQSAVARFEAGGTVPSLPVLDRLATALDADLVVQFTPRVHIA